MTKFKKLAIAVAVASAAMMPMASNATVVIDGVAFNAGDQLITTALWESTLTSVSDTLSGVGIVSQINCAGCGGATWISGQNNTQLTYYFSGYSVDRWYDGSIWHAKTDNTGFSAATAIDFTGGVINLYSDRYTGGTLLNPSANPNVINSTLMAADIANATDGNLWLSYAGVTTTDLLSGRIGSLFASTNTINSVHSGGSGFGYLDVVAGGLATVNFDTNSYNIGGIIADARLDSSFSTPNSGAWPLSGTAAIKTNAIPEPGSVALLGLGLIGLAATYRRKSSKKA